MFAHYTVALLSVAVAPYLLVRILPAASVRQGLAYNSVVHDDIAHAAMTEHRNWALVTASLFVILALWPWGR